MTQPDGAVEENRVKCFYVGARFGSVRTNVEAAGLRRAAMDWLGWKRVLTPAGYFLLLGVIAVFIHSGLQSDFGLAAYHEARAEERRLTARLEKLRARRTVIANRVRRLSGDYLDLDLLDERARRVLGLMRDDELIVR